jgi:hypothetical protein
MDRLTRQYTPQGLVFADPPHELRGPVVLGRPVQESPFDWLRAEFGRNEPEGDWWEDTHVDLGGEGGP